MSKLLTIAIPTFNRYETLKESLDSISNQWHLDLSDEIEVIVSDNASDDETPTIVEYTSFKNVNAKYIRNVTNVGPDRNWFNCWNLAEGKYVLLLSDDDVLFPGCISACVNLLKENPDILYLTVGNWSDRDKDIKLNESILEYHSDDEFIKKLGLTITVLSSLVLKKENINTEKLESYVGTFFTQVYAVIDIMKDGSKHYLIRETPSIGNRPGNQRLYNLYTQWLVYFQDAAMHFTELGLSKKFCKEIFRDSIRKHIRHWLVTFTRESTRLDTRITLQSIVRTISYSESWKYLYWKMVKLWVAQLKRKYNRKNR